MVERIGNAELYLGDCREILRSLPDESVHCVVTSPPYWGLRDYGIEPVIWGGADCDHEWGEAIPGDPRGGSGPNAKECYGGQDGATNYARQVARGNFCRHCNAWRGTLGLEPSIELYIQHMVEVFGAVRRVLRKDGTVWLNLGDCYASTPPGNKATGVEKWRTSGLHGGVSPKYAATLDQSVGTKSNTICPGLKPKDLVMVPARVALALQEDGWWLRSQAPWLKRNVLPESVNDRPATAIEYMFLLSKSARYAYDADAVAMPASPNTHARVSQNVEAQTGSFRANGGAKTNGPMKAVVKRPKRIERDGRNRANEDFENATCQQVLLTRNRRNADWFFESWQGLLLDDCGLPQAFIVNPQPFRDAHYATFPEKLVEPCIKAGCPEGGTVLDPFGGSGTVGVVAHRLNRQAILIEAKNDGIAPRRLAGATRQHDLFIEQRAL